MTAAANKDSVTEQELSAPKIPRLFPLRLGFMSLMFLAFFTISVLILNVSKVIGFGGEQDVYQLVLDVLRVPVQEIPIAREIYDIIVFPLHGAEALYISSGFVLTFFTVSLLATRARVSRHVFQGRKRKRIPLQVIIFFSIFTGFMYLIRVGLPLVPGLDENNIPIYILVIGASAWIFFQSVALFTAARRSGTRIEARATRRGGKGAIAMSIAGPFLVVAFIVALYIGYGIFQEIAAIVLGVSNPLWTDLVRWFTLGMLALCLLPSLAVLSSANKRKKAFDNLIVIMTIFFLYPYLLFNFTIYFGLPKGGLGGGGTGDPLIGQIFLLVDLVFTLLLLVMALRSVGKRTGYKFGKLDKHAFIMFIYAALSGQFGIRYLQTRDLLPDLGGIDALLLDGQYLLVNFGVVIAIFGSVLLFSSKKFSLYFSVHEDISKEDKKRVAFIVEFLNAEYVRSGMITLTADIYDSIATVMKTTRFEAMQLLEKARRQTGRLVVEGVKKRYVYFR